MQGNRFRRPNSGSRQRPASSFQSGRAWNVGQNRRSFSGEANERQLPASAVQRPLSRFNTSPSLPVVPLRASVDSPGSSDSFSSPPDDGRADSVARFPVSKPDSTIKHDEVEKLDNCHSADYESIEVEDYTGPSVPQIEEAIGSFAGS